MNPIRALPTSDPACPVHDTPLTAMVAVDAQEALGSRYEPVQALLHGTLFPALYKPMGNEQLPITSCRIERRQALSFALWELRLYLDTQPADHMALRLLREMDCAVEHPSYATAFLPPSTMEQPEGACACSVQYDWVDDPWPWEIGP